MAETWDELLPCPFCGGGDARMTRHPDPRSPTKEVWSMACYQCGATFPSRYKKHLLVEAWNRRAGADASPVSAGQTPDTLA